MFLFADAHFDLQPVKEHGVQEESRLLNYLMSNYDREVRPVYNASQKVVVRVGITLTQIFDMVSWSSCRYSFPLIMSQVLKMSTIYGPASDFCEGCAEHL